MSAGDHVESLIARLRDQLNRSEPHSITAARVFNDGIDELTDVEIDALEVAGFEIVAREGEPAEVRVPSVARMIEKGQPYDHAAIDPEDRPKVIFLGFLAVAHEAFRAEANSAM